MHNRRPMECKPIDNLVIKLTIFKERATRIILGGLYELWLLKVPLYHTLKSSDVFDVAPKS